MSKDPLLLTPGPLTTSAATKAAMLRDWGSWDSDFHGLTADIRAYLLACANATDSHVCVPMQGSGTFAVEATLGTLCALDKPTLVLCNGAYGQRMVRLLERMGRPVYKLDMGDLAAPRAADLHAFLDSHPDVANVAVVHCETSTGILNPIAELAAVCAERDKGFIIDSMSAFGAIPIDAQQLPFTALVSSANKCFEGVPGFGFALVERQALEQSAGRCHSLSLDLHDQWSYMERTGQWRFTPPTHVLAAFHQALAEHRAEGGVTARHQRYRARHERMVAGLRSLGLRTLLEDAWLSPIITTFLAPEHPNFEFTTFYEQIKAQGFLIYPGKLTEQETFRVGHIGQLSANDAERLVDAVATALDAMNIPLRTPTAIMSEETL